MAIVMPGWPDGLVVPTYEPGNIVLVEVGLFDEDGEELCVPGYGRLACAFHFAGEIYVCPHPIMWVAAGRWPKICSAGVFVGGAYPTLGLIDCDHGFKEGHVIMIEAGYSLPLRAVALLPVEEKEKWD